MDIIRLAFDMTAAVQEFVEKVRRFYYWVMLLGYRCPKCNGLLVMVCSVCGGIPILRIRRYLCKDCGGDITSKFLFDGTVFNSDYFRQKMSESRQRKKQQRERVRQMLAESRSANLQLPQVDLDSMPGLVDALNGLSAGPRDHFDLKRYERHIQAHIKDFPVSLLDIPPLSEDARKDLIWRFIAAIFLAHAGVVDIWQDERDIMVIEHEANTEGCGVPGEFEDADRVKGSLGGIEA